jgi:hypothetical protein
MNKRSFVVFTLTLSAAGTAFGQTLNPQAPIDGQARTKDLMADIVPKPPVLESLSGSGDAAASAQTKAIALAANPAFPQGTTSTPSQQAVNVTAAELRQDATAYKVTLVESSYPEVVRKDQFSSYASVNVPPGWKLQQLRGLKFEPAPQVKLANNETYEVQSTPFVLVPASNVTRVAINPRALQTLHNFQLAQLDLLRQLRDSLSPKNKPVTPID